MSLYVDTIAADGRVHTTVSRPRGHADGIVQTRGMAALLYVATHSGPLLSQVDSTPPPPWETLGPFTSSRTPGPRPVSP